MKRGRSDDVVDETQNDTAVWTVRVTVATKLTNVLESWDSFTKEDLRRRITLIRDELTGNATDCLSTHSFSPLRLKTDKCISMNKMDEIVYGEVALALETAKTKIAFCKLSGRGGVEVDMNGAIALLEERVKKGDCEAMWMLGLCYEYGMGTEQNIEKAEELYGESHDGENVVGEFLMKNGKGRRGTGVMKVNGL